MKELVKVQTNENLEPIISGRELHEKLEIKTPYTQWIDRMLEYGFVENLDFTLHSQKCESSNISGVKVIQNHNLTLDTAKEICMLQRNEKGKMFRQYFIQVEKDFNSPEKIMARALKIADKKIKTQDIKIKELEGEVEIKNQLIGELRPAKDYLDTILASKNTMKITQIANDYGLSARALNKILENNRIIRKVNGQWILYINFQNKGYTKSNTININSFTSVVETVWTQKGRIFIHNVLKELGYKANVDKEFQNGD